MSVAETGRGGMGETVLVRGRPDCEEGEAGLTETGGGTRYDRGSKGGAEGGTRIGEEGQGCREDRGSDGLAGRERRIGAVPIFKRKEKSLAGYFKMF